MIVVNGPESSATLPQVSTMTEGVAAEVAETNTENNGNDSGLEPNGTDYRVGSNRRILFFFSFLK